MNERGRNLEQVQSRLVHEEKMRKEVEDSMRRLERTYAELVDQFKVEMDSKEATIETLKKKLTVTFVQDILFRTGETVISSDGKKMLKKIGTVLKQNGSDKIVVRGHSDTMPIAKENRERFPSNWELSAARAAAVVRYFQYATGINPRRMEAVGASFYQPVAGNDRPEDRARNRRVEIFITPNGQG
jgi:chemotaxis protein MotB